jgi:hypothetical protein
LADADSIRIELAFDGGQIIAANVTSETADALERAIAATSQSAIMLDTDDGRLSVAVPRLVYVKRYARDSKVGFDI